MGARAPKFLLWRTKKVEFFPQSKLFSRIPKEIQSNEKKLKFSAGFFFKKKKTWLVFWKKKFFFIILAAGLFKPAYRGSSFFFFYKKLLYKQIKILPGGKTKTHLNLPPKKNQVTTFLKI